MIIEWEMCDRFFREAYMLGLITGLGIAAVFVLATILILYRRVKREVPGA